MYNKVDKKNYLDIRIFEMQNGKLCKTDKGAYFPTSAAKEVKQCLDDLIRRMK